MDLRKDLEDREMVMVEEKEITPVRVEDQRPVAEGAPAKNGGRKAL